MQVDLLKFLYTINFQVKNFKIAISQAILCESKTPDINRG